MVDYLRLEAERAFPFGLFRSIDLAFKQAIRPKLAPSAGALLSYR
jgi:hypothetical protein